VFPFLAGAALGSLGAGYAYGYPYGPSTTVIEQPVPYPTSDTTYIVPETQEPTVSYLPQGDLYDRDGYRFQTSDMDEQAKTIARNIEQQFGLQPFTSAIYYRLSVGEHFSALAQTYHLSDGVTAIVPFSGSIRPGDATEIASGQVLIYDHGLPDIVAISPSEGLILHRH
jgi:hypothetical protein